MIPNLSGPQCLRFVVCLSIFAAICTGTSQGSKAEVSSIKTSELKDFDSYPPKVKNIVEYSLELTTKDLGYQFGSNSPANGGMDCSGTVQHILTHLGYQSPRQCNLLYLWVRKNGNLYEVNTPRSLSEESMSSLKPGDLVFWEGTYNVEERFPPTSHVMIFLGHLKSNGKPVMVGSSSGRYYNGKARHGVSVFDFRLPRLTSASKLVGYGPVPGVKSLDRKLPLLVKPPKNTPAAGLTKTAPEKQTVTEKEIAPPSKTSQVRQLSAVAKTTDSVTGEPWRYLVYLPKRYHDSPESAPLLIYLHGSSVKGRDLEKLKRYGPPALLDNQDDFPFVVVSPQLPEGSWPSKSLLAFTNEMVATYHVDPDRIYLTGTSMGAGAAWYLAAEDQNRFAALSTIGGFGETSIAKKLTKLPVWAFHGGKDDIVPLKPHRDLVDAINKEGGNARITVFPDGTHGNIIMPVYRNQELYDWFLQQKRDQVSTGEILPTPTKKTVPPDPETASKPPASTNSKPRPKPTLQNRNETGKKAEQAIKKFFKDLTNQ